MSEYHVRLDASIKAAQKSVRAMKRASPSIFPEWSRLLSARMNLKLAKVELARAERAWDALGKPIEGGGEDAMSDFKQRQKQLYEALREQSAKSMEIARKAQEAMQRSYEQIWGKR